MLSDARVAIRLVLALFTSLGVIASTSAQTKVSTERVSFDAATVKDGGVTVYGELRIPESTSGRVPAVLLLHNAAGWDNDHVSAGYREVLNRAGIATLGINMFPSRDALPRSTREVMPHVYGSLLFLAAHPRIDPQRVGVLGFSYGGVLSLITSSSEVTQEYTGGKARFAAHLALYPVCWIHRQIFDGSNRVYGAATYKQVTGAPVHILAGEKDDYDEPDTCPKFIAALPSDVRKHFSVTVYPGAYHAFDWPGGNFEHSDRIAFLGRGGTVTNQFDAGTAAKAWAYAEEFFSKKMGVGK